MKNIFIKNVWLLMSLFIIAACSPQDIDDYALDSLATITPEQVSFSKTVSDKSDNIITFTNTTDVKTPVSIAWDLGNGTRGKSNKMTGQYPQKGDYTVTLTVYSSDGTAVSKSEVVSIQDDDFGLINTPVYRNLTGGVENSEGKVWVFDQYNNFTKEVADALAPLKSEYPENERLAAYDIKGHLGLGPQNSFGQNWWAAGPNEKNTWTLYDFKFTFIQDGVKLEIENEGEGYGRNASAESVGGFDVIEVDGDDAVFTFGGGDFNFSIDEDGEYPQLTLSDNSFMGFYAGSQVYDIIYQTEEVMCLRVNNTVEEQDWVFVYCLEELNISEPPLVIELKEVPLSETFEDSVLTVPFLAQELGDKTGVVDNPMLVPINESDKVYRYQKSNDFYGNLFFEAEGYKFDLTKQNKITLKVYIPSYNDYETSNDVAGDWIAESRLRPQLSVKLQDSDRDDMAWETQTEIEKKDLETDKWIELEFDFSEVADREDYDKIVIQFGAEGHSGEGFFFFDDFKFSE